MREMGAASVSRSASRSGDRTQPRSIKSRWPMKPISILVADDESNIRLMLRTSLESEGYAVTEAADGREALREIQNHAPDLVVLDLNMPNVDGMQVLKQLKSMAEPKPRVIVLTAFGSIAAAV